MFIVNVIFTRGLAEVESHLEAHMDFVKDQYKKENFIASGIKNPRTGGVILSKVADRKTLDEILDCDPFKKVGIAKYEVVEFTPNMTGVGYEILKE